MIHLWVIWVSAFLFAMSNSEAILSAQIQRARQAIVMGTKQESMANWTAAEDLFLKAYDISKYLPPQDYRIESEALWHLGRLYSKEKKEREAADFYKKRIVLLKQHSNDLDLGIALSDLQSLYESLNNQTEAESMMHEASKFYESCSSQSSTQLVCDRRLADVQGLYGSYLFTQHRLSEATPYLQAVVSRNDEHVRPEVLESSLLCLYTILLSKDPHTSKLLLKRALELRQKYPDAQSIPLPNNLR